jgi:hypothetical protein
MFVENVLLKQALHHKFLQRINKVYDHFFILPNVVVRFLPFYQEPVVVK